MLRGSIRKHITKVEECSSDKGESQNSNIHRESGFGLITNSAKQKKNYAKIRKEYPAKGGIEDMGKVRLIADMSKTNER